MLILFIQAVLSSQAAVITFSAPANYAADTDVKATPGFQMKAITYGGAATVNGVSFTASSAIGGVAPYYTLSGFSGTTSTTLFYTNVSPFNALSASYTNLLRGGVYNSSGANNVVGTVTLSNLLVGGTYFVQMWTSDPRVASSNRVENIYSGGATNKLFQNSTHSGAGQSAGGVGQFTSAKFTADATTQVITLDASNNIVNPDGGYLLLNAIQLRDVTGVWSGTTSGNWNDPDSTTANFSGNNYNTVKTGTTNGVYFGDVDASGSSVATSAITVGAGGVTGENVIFANNLVSYTFASADANGIKGAYTVTLNGTNTVTFNGANTYTGTTRLNAGTLALGNASALGGSTNILLTGGTLDTTAATLTLGSSQTLQGAGTINGSLAAGSGATIFPGNGPSVIGTINVTNALTLNAAALTFDVPSSPAIIGDKITIGGVLTLNGNPVVTLNQLNPVLVDGTYTLMTYASKSGSGNFTLNTTYPGVAINTGSSSVTLTVTGHGAIALWNGNTGNTNWSANTNWSGNVLPASGDNLVINDSTLANLYLDDGSHTNAMLVFGTNATRTTAFTIVGTTNLPYATNALVITKGLVASNAASISLTVSSPVTIQGDQTWTVNCAAGANQGTLSAAKGVLIKVPATAGTNKLTLNGTLTKSGLGMLKISQGMVVGDGNIVVQQGTLVLESIDNQSGAMPLVVDGTGSITVSNGAAIGLSAGLAGSFMGSKQIILSNTATVNCGWNGTSFGVCPLPIQWNGTNTVNWTPSSFGGFVFSNSWTGNSVVTINNSSASLYQFRLDKDNSGFSGKVILSSTPSTGNEFRFADNSSGSPNAEWSINGANITMKIFKVSSTVTNVQLGALSGTAGTLSTSVGNNTTGTYVVGALNTSTTCAAKLVDGSTPTGILLALTKVGSGTLTLTSSSSTYTGGSIVSNGILASMSATASAVGNGPVSIMSGGTFSGIGPSSSCAVTNYAGGTLDTPGGTTLTLNNLTLGVSSTDVTATSINVANGGLINSGASLTVNGTNIINITGSSTNVGVYNLISYTGSIGGAGFNGFKLGSLPAGMGAILQDSGTAVQLNVTAYTTNATPTNIVFSVSGGSLNMSWPTDHLGWRLQCQTNTLSTGLQSVWFDVPGSTAVTSTNFPIVTANPTIFYRLVFP